MGIWNSLLSNIRGLLGGVDSLSALCNSLKSPVPIFIGIPMMMHSETPTKKPNMLNIWQVRIYKTVFICPFCMHCLSNLFQAYTLKIKVSSLDKVKVYGHGISMLFNLCCLNYRWKKMQPNLNTFSSNGRASEGLFLEKTHSTQCQEQKMQGKVTLCSSSDSVLRLQSNLAKFPWHAHNFPVKEAYHYFSYTTFFAFSQFIKCMFWI